MRAAALGSLVAAAAACALIFGTDVGLVAQFLLGKMAYSTSNAASLTLLTYLVLALWVSVLRRNSAGGAIALALMAVALTVGHALNLWLTLRYLHEFELPAGVHLYHWQGADNSFTGLLHSHLGKTALAWGTQVLGWSSPAYDTGRVFLPWVPQGAPGLLLTAFGVATGGALAGMPAVARQHKGHPGAMVMYVLSSLACLKAMLDGGPLAHAVPPAMVALTWVCLPATLRHSHARLLAVLAAAVLGGYLGLWLVLSPERPVPVMGSFLFPLALYGWLWLVTTGRSMSLRLVLVGFLTVSVVLDAADNLAPYLYSQSAQCRAYSLRPQQPMAEPVSCAGESAFQVYLRLGDDPRKPHHTLISQTEGAGSHDFQGVLQVIDTRSNRLLFPSGAAWQTITLVPMAQAQRLGVVATARADLPPVFVQEQGNAISRNNYYVYLHQLSAALRTAGMTEFLIVPATQSNPSVD